MESEGAKMTQASPVKLRNGNWGARVRGAVNVGDVVQVTTKAGKSWAAVVQQVVWAGEGVSICATTASDDRSHNHAPAGRVYDHDRFNGYGRARGGSARVCKTGGNCSSFGSGRSCGSPDCDGY